MIRNHRKECTSVQEAIFYRDQEAAYRTWLAKHPDGWVLNTNRRPSNRYLILHRTSCHTISQYRQHEGTEAFTGGRYAKACATHPGALLAWIKERGFDTFTGFCSACKTSEDSLNTAAASGSGIASEPPGSPGEDDAWREGQIRIRRGQAKFRAKLLKAYGQQCAVTGTKLEALLEAAHIAPHAGGTDYRVTNGLLLRADIHTLYDLHHLSVDAQGKIHLSKEARRTEYKVYHGTFVRPPLTEASKPAAQNLADRHGRFLSAEAARE